MNEKVLTRLFLKAVCIFIITAMALNTMPVTEVWAQTFTVTRTDDPVPDGCNSGDCSLREAIIDANALGGTNTIVLGGNTYTLSITGSEDFAASGDLDIRSDSDENPHDLTITGIRGSATIVDGGDLFRVFQVVHSAATLRFVQVTIQNGNASSSGGGIHNNNGGTVILTGSYVKENSAGTAGGGIYNTGDLVLTSSHVSDNSATNSGGGIWNNGDLSLASSAIYQNTGGTGGGIQNVGGVVTISYSQIITNTANASTAASGGGIYTIHGEVSLTSTYVQNNTAQSGGGIYNSGSDSELTLLESVVSGNEATTSSGGGINNLEGAFNLTDTTISSNSAENHGGGIHTTTGGDQHVIKSTVSDNTANENGGGIFIGSGSALVLLNSTVSGNTAGDNGGGIYNSDTVTLTFSTVSDNTATGQGDGVYNSPGDLATFSSTIMANTPASDNCAGLGTFTSQGNNLDSGTSCGFSVALSNADPMLGALQNNGGPTSTHALLTGSDAIDAGNNSVCPFTDQRGALRPISAFLGGGTCDIGAYEAEGFYIIFVPWVLSPLQQ